MALFSGMFKTPKHRVFNYQPLYYDARKEALEEKLEEARKREMEEGKPGDLVKFAFKRDKMHSKRSVGYSGTVRTIITCATTVILIIAVMYIAKYMEFFY